MKLELDCVAMDKIVVAYLKEDFAILDMEYDIPMFSYDKKEEKKRKKELRKALELVIAYHSP